jgi:hypothetical protein
MCKKKQERKEKQEKQRRKILEKEPSVNCETMERDKD